MAEQIPELNEQTASVAEEQLIKEFNNVNSDIEATLAHLELRKGKQ